MPQFSHLKKMDIMLRHINSVCGGSQIGNAYKAFLDLWKDAAMELQCFPVNTVVYILFLFQMYWIAKQSAPVPAEVPPLLVGWVLFNNV